MRFPSHSRRLPVSHIKCCLLRSCHSKNGGMNDKLDDIKLPDVPTTCCMSGCANCVWIEYANKLNEIFKDGGEKSLKIIDEKITDLNMKAFLKMELKLVACDFFSLLDANHCNEKTNLIFIEENHGSNSSFVISSFMWQAKAMENAEIILLTCHNSIQHYQYVLNKWGHAARSSSLKTNVINLSDFFEDPLDLPKLFETIYENCVNLNNLKTYLIIDDLSYFLMLSSLRQCVHFSQQLLRLLTDFKLLKVIVCCHVSKKDEELLIISKHFHHLSNCILSLEPLKSGFSNEVTGHLNITRKINLKSNVNRYNFKLDDKKFTLNPYVI